MANSKKFNFSESIRTKNNFDNLIDEKYNIVYLNFEDIKIRENQVFELQDDNYISSLAEDIKNNGLDNALIVRKLDNNKYDLICGRHRLLALKQLNETKIPCIIQNLTDDESEIKLINSNLNQIIEIMLDVILSKEDKIKVSGRYISKEIVKSRFLLLRYEHVEYVLESIRKNSKKATNIRNYLITCLYNSYSTILVNIDNDIANMSY